MLSCCPSFPLAFSSSSPLSFPMVSDRPDRPFPLDAVDLSGKNCTSYIPDLYDLYDLRDLYDLAHGAGWEPYGLHGLQ